MPQILKDDVKTRIVEAAKEEFMENTYEKSSMRSIANKSKITVGNLYRYFRSKDELNDFIVGKTLGKIQELVLSLTDNQVNILNMESINLTSDQMRSMLDRLGNGLVDIYLDHKVEVNILMMNSALNRYLTRWFADAIAQIISTTYKIEQEKPEVRLMADSYAEAIFGGLKHILRNNNVDTVTLKKLVKIYMESYVDMLDVDFITRLQED